jgi:hypothetical protein
MLKSASTIFMSFFTSAALTLEAIHNPFLHQEENTSWSPVTSEQSDATFEKGKYGNKIIGVFHQVKLA